ncbi:xanthine dehydrogenase family protein subunit M [Actinomadura spongiicola]|uniref:Xanthine dehydrogenase family protein subunit M n=1 Tax=Actinomadura spongiicola TaxID=2303421 RepID=A0A372GJG3_9ACTN|nr:xanthine dehydrogenase family protein subunit M [Actinomadura spongiicola]RFS85342.1 xanthine dehydrogenase family protein subunit M [Actinomadura spongiicola]
MKPPPFGYRAPVTLDEALDALAARPSGKVLAGGQSLIPLLNMRLAAPPELVDINRVAELDTLHVGDGGVRVGALARHTRVERSAAAAAVQPLLRRALRHVAHPVIRNRGTVVGSLAHADPAAELPAVLAVLDGTVDAASTRGRRTIPAADFFVGPLEPALEPGELAVSAYFPAAPPRTGTAFMETARRHGDYAIAGVAAVVTLDDDLRVSAARAGYLGISATPLVLDLTGAAGPHGDWTAAAAHVRDTVDPVADIHAGAAYRRHLTGVLTERALKRAAAEALRKAED